MKKLILIVTASVLFFQGTVFAGFNCITEKRGVNIAWFGTKGKIEITNVRKFTDDFKVKIDFNKKGNTAYEGVPKKGEKIDVPKGINDVLLYISSGEGEICYSRSN